MTAMATGGSGTPLLDRCHGDANLAQHVAWGWRMLAVPVVSAIHGVAFGGGFQIMSGADIRIAHPDTRFAIRESHWGLVPDMAGIALWRSLVRDDIVRELTYTGREFGAADAQAHGFVTHIDTDPHARAYDLAREIAGRNPDAARAAKRLFNAAFDANSAEILRAESAEQTRLLRSPNQREAVRANMEKRPPRFTDA